jgi:hypothetical protein
MSTPLLSLVPLVFGMVARSRIATPDPSWLHWIGDSRNGVFLVLILAFVVGGGRKWMQAMAARRAVDGLQGDRPDVAAIEESAKHGRSGVVDLFRLLDSSPERAVRDAAGRALAALWKADELIPEEEQAVVTRGFVATWKARRRYPRALERPIPIVVEFGVPFLSGEGSGIGRESLEWSYRVLGTDRVSLETYSEWAPGPGLASFSLDPRDFPTNGPHRLLIQARVRTSGLTTFWERELPQVPFTFEFDPQLALNALLTLPDEARAAAIASAVTLAPVPSAATEPSYLPLNSEFALRDPPSLAIAGPLPCDLAHAVFLEIEGWPQIVGAGGAVFVGSRAEGAALPLALAENLPSEAIDRPGDRKIRAILTVDPHRAWADPDIRSVWPGSIETEWTSVRVVRR